MKILLVRAFLLYTIFFIGCAHTRIAPRPVPSEAKRLVSLASHSVSIRIECPIDDVVGHQYLLIFLPFGRISISEIEKHFENALVTEMSQSGIAAHISARGETAQYTLTCKALSLSAYDFLFFRRISSQLSLVLSEGRSRGAEIPLVAEESEYRALAFHAQLERVLHKLLTSAAKSVVIHVATHR